MAKGRGSKSAPPFSVWGPASIEVTGTNLHDVVWINGGVRSVELAFGLPRLLIQSRFRAARDMELDAQDAFEGEALSYFARSAPLQLPSARPMSLDVVFNEAVLSMPVRLSAILCMSVTLEQIGMPESAVDIASPVIPTAPFELVRLDRGTVAVLLTHGGSRSPRGQL